MTADEAQAELDRIRESNGALRPDLIVAAAEPEDAVLHPAFEWDDSAAAREYRLQQARNLVRAIVVTEDDAPARAVYVHVRQPEEQSGEYVPMEVVVSQPDQFTLALAGLNRHLAAAKQSVNELTALAQRDGDPERTVRIAIAMHAFDAAAEAVKALH